MNSRVVTTVCRFCPVGCGMNAYVKDERIEQIEGLPEDPRTRGGLCPKGRATIDVLYSPDRLLHPLKRIGARGEGQWEEIGWPVALEEITDRLNAIRRTDGARAISVYRGQASDWGASWLYALRFMNALGSPNAITPSHLCYTPRMMAHLLTYGGMVEPDYVNARCLVVWGANPTGTNERAPFGRPILEAKARGVKLIVVDPFRTELAEKADLWLRVRPGTDCALALAMLSTIVEEGLYDREFVGEWCTGFEALQEHVTRYAPSAVAELTGIPASLIVEAARTFAQTRPGAIFEGNGLDQHVNVVQTVRALCLLRAVTGNIEVKGADVFPDTLSRTARDIKLNDLLPPAEKPLGGYDFYFHMARIAPPPPVIDAILTGQPYPVRALIVQGGNPLVTLAHTQKTEQALRKVDFLVVMDPFLTQTARLADIVLPAALFPEFTNLTGYPGLRTNYPLLQQKVVEPQGEAWPDWKLWFELAKRLGFGEHFPWEDVEEAIDYQLGPTGFTAAHLKGRILVIPKRYEKFRSEGFFTGSKKVELYSKTMSDFGQAPLPEHLDASHNVWPDAATKRDYPLLGTSYPRTPLYTHTEFRQIGKLRRGDPDPLVYIHPDDAASRSITDGEQVRVRSPLGAIRVKAAVSDGVQPGVIGLTWGWGEAVREAGTNELVDDTLRDPICGATSNRLFPCRLEKII
jgi:anaerobic selenocysteine-containing dehydrogenase